MSEDILKKLTDRKAELEKTLLEAETNLKEFSQKVSQSQITIVETRAEIKGLDKIIKLITQ